jgi:hypothetical protein
VLLWAFSAPHHPQVVDSFHVFTWELASAVLRHDASEVEPQRRAGLCRSGSPGNLKTELMASFKKGKG